MAQVMSMGGATTQVAFVKRFVASESLADLWCNYRSSSNSAHAQFKRPPRSHQQKQRDLHGAVGTEKASQSQHHANGSVMPAFCRPTPPHLSFATVAVEKREAPNRRILTQFCGFGP
jgi:hypothetical protein